MTPVAIATSQSILRKPLLTLKNLPKNYNGNLANVKIAIDKKELNGKIANQQVNVTIFSTVQWNAKEIDTATLQFGFAYISPENRATAISKAYQALTQIFGCLQ